MTEEAATAAIESACKVLRMPTMRQRYPETATSAEKQQLSYRGFLAELLLTEMRRP